MGKLKKMRLSVFLALVAVASGIRINADPQPEVDAPKKGPFDKSDAEERKEKLAFTAEQDAIKRDQGCHPDNMTKTEVKPNRANIINQKKFWADNEDHVKKSDIVEAKPVASLNPKAAKAEAEAKDAK